MNTTLLRHGESKWIVCEPLECTLLSVRLRPVFLNWDVWFYEPKNNTLARACSSIRKRVVLETCVFYHIVPFVHRVNFLGVCFYSVYYHVQFEYLLYLFESGFAFACIRDGLQLAAARCESIADLWIITFITTLLSHFLPRLTREPRLGSQDSTLYQVQYWFHSTTRGTRTIPMVFAHCTSSWYQEALVL